MFFDVWFIVAAGAGGGGDAAWPPLGEQLDPPKKPGHEYAEDAPGDTGPL